MLDKQIHLYSLGTGFFHTKEEQIKVNEINVAKKYIDKINQGEFKKSEVLEKCEKVTKGNILDVHKVLAGNCLMKVNKKEIKSILNEYIKNARQDLDKLFEDNINHRITRTLNAQFLTDDRVVSSFDSFLTRTLGLDSNAITDELFIVEVFYTKIAQSLIENGFIYKGEKYRFFSASAGQIRTKKIMFIKESTWEKYQYTLSCGIDLDHINNLGGINVNKYLAYLALTNTSSDEWSEFDIDKCIVVDDFASIVNDEVDFIDEQTYDITRQHMDVPIEHTDGCGMISPELHQSNFIVRLPWIKGLLSPFDFKKFIVEKNGSSKITDIYGDMYDIIEDDIQVIFTKSQFKMYKYYENWADYKDKYKKHKCQAGIVLYNAFGQPSEVQYKRTKMNYQCLQSLTKYTNKDIKNIIAQSVQELVELNNTVENAMKFCSYFYYGHPMYYFNKAIQIYPELLYDKFSRKIISSKKQSLTRQGKEGRLIVNGKYLFILPDLYAFCEKLFLGIENPHGLLKRNQISCNVYPDYKELACVRSPHLYREWAVKVNKTTQEIGKWFISDGVYVSCNDTISKLLQADFDGDKVLVIADKNIVKLAKKNMKGVVPLFYHMRKASNHIVDAHGMYEGMRAAWVSGNIGVISNNISKIWNSKGGINEEKLKVIKWLCMENNYSIDFAKTLYMPTRPKNVDAIIKKHTSEKLPYFFRYLNKQIPKEHMDEKTKTLVNSLSKYITSKRLYFKEMGVLDYTLFMSNPDIVVDEDICEYFQNNAKSFDAYGNVVDEWQIYSLKGKLLNKGYSLEEILDMLIKYYYIDTDIYDTANASKTNLWIIFGESMYQNLIRNMATKGMPLSYCRHCGKRVAKSHLTDEMLCEECDEIENPKPKYITCECCGKQHNISHMQRPPRLMLCDDCRLEHRRYRVRMSARRQQARKREQEQKESA